MNTNDLTHEQRLELRRSVAVECRERMSALNLVGKRRDDASLHYMIGAAKAFDLTGQGRMKDLMVNLIADMAFPNPTGVMGWKTVQAVIDADLTKVSEDA